MNPWFTFALTACISSGALAAAPDEVSSKTAELDALNFFEGFWHCEDPSDTVGQTSSSVLVVKKELEDSWLTFKWDAGSASSSSFTHGHAYMTWDALLEKYIDFSFSIHGGYGAAMSDGLRDGTLMFTGGINNYQGATVYLRKTYTKTADNSFMLSIEVSSDGETFENPTTKTCVKAQGTPRL